MAILPMATAREHLKITEEQRQRFVELYMAALDKAGMPDDEPNADGDEELHPLQEVPRWSRPGDETPN